MSGNNDERNYFEQTLGEAMLTIVWTFVGTLMIVGTIMGIALWIP